MAAPTVGETLKISRDSDRSESRRKALVIPVVFSGISHRDN
jgi:hypothetical protein